MTFGIRSSRPPTAWMATGWLDPAATTVIPIAELPRALPHDLANALAAAAVATGGRRHPGRLPRGLGEHPALPTGSAWSGRGTGCAGIDDSKATTPASVLAAVAGFSSVVLIAGGRNKGLDLGALAATVPPVRAVVAIGEAAAEVERRLLRAGARDHGGQHGGRGRSGRRPGPAGRRRGAVPGLRQLRLVRVVCRPR